uniref:Egrl-2 n=1 Tax=Dendrocoelum lacteum TaxID=27895 RepID=T1E1F4_9PLAT
MDSPPSTGEMDSKEIIALVGTDKLDGSELDNVKTGLTPPSHARDFYDIQYRVEDIATPMRFEEDECSPGPLEDIPGEITQEVVPQYRDPSQRFEVGIEGKRSRFALSSVKGCQFPLEKDSTSMTYSTQLSKICLDDILPIIKRESQSKSNITEFQRNIQEEDEESTKILEAHHSWDVASTSYVSYPTTRQTSSTGSISKPKKQFQCSYETCKRKFNRSDELNRHTRVHSGIKPYTCEYCFKNFARSDHLKTHRRTHTGERPFECEICAKKFARSDEKSRHSRTHTKGRGLSKVFTAPESMSSQEGTSSSKPEVKEHRASDGSITYKF